MNITTNTPPPVNVLAAVLDRVNMFDHAEFQDIWLGGTKLELAVW